MDIYIKLPKNNMKLERKNIKDHLGDQKTKDVLIDPKGEIKDILLQDCVKEFIRGYRRNKPNKLIEGLLIISKPLQYEPKNNDEIFIEYHYNNNGALPTKTPIDKIKYMNVMEMKRPKKVIKTTYGEKWHHKIHLSNERKKEVLEKEKEVRENRRHTGDSPKST